jgi:gliding motility-associated-like protein
MRVFEIQYKSIKWIILPFYLFFTVKSFSQLNARTIGDASNQGANCFIVTPDVLGQSGGVWYDNPIDFSTDFTISYQNNFGNKDANGADGMALVFKSNANPLIGEAGGGLGYGGISPSITIEFDTWQNTENADPIWDHIAITQNGIPNHNLSTTLAGPVQASNTSTNIEDGLSHEIKISWNAASQLLTVFFDCVIRLSTRIDVNNTIFSGEDEVFFGFVASTGGFSNFHQLCFNSISFIQNLVLEDTIICLGDAIVLDATIPSGAIYRWSPISGVSDPTSPNPSFSPTQTATYTVIIEDICGETITEEVTITVFPFERTPTFNQVSEICNGDDLIALPNISNEGISGSWSPALDNTATTTYTFTPNLNQCARAQTMTIIVNDKPEIQLLDEYFICYDTNDNVINSDTINTGLPFTDFNFYWLVNGNLILDETNSFYTPIVGGTYEVVIQNSRTFCEEKFAATITELFEPEFDPRVISDVFVDTQTIEVFSESSAVFEYNLDNGFWQSGSIFSNVSIGEHIIGVRDIRGCIESFQSIIVIGYPKYFTPNNDGINDTWNIIAPENPGNFLDSAEVFIFDRYGRLLEKLNPKTKGWLGVYKGNELPADDYWFVIKYNEPTTNERKQFRSHFALKR